MREIYRLPIKKNRRPKVKPKLQGVHTGFKTSLCLTSSELADELLSLRGLIGGYEIDQQGARILPIRCNEKRCEGYVWDPELRFPVAVTNLLQEGQCFEQLQQRPVQSNYCQLHQVLLTDPVIEERQNAQALTIDFNLAFAYEAAHYSAELGMVTLVESRRYLTLDDQSQVIIIDTQSSEQPVVYLQAQQDEQPIKPIGQPLRQAHPQPGHVQLRFAQTIPEIWAGRGVAELTVLEEYHHYLLQRPIATPHTTIWVPALEPISWGWSMRAGRRRDQSWCILRRKLIQPFLRPDGLDFPLWSDSVKSFCQPVYWR